MNLSSAFSNEESDSVFNQNQMKSYTEGILSPLSFQKSSLKKMQPIKLVKTKRRIMSGYIKLKDPGIIST